MNFHNHVTIIQIKKQHYPIQESQLLVFLIFFTEILFWKKWKNVFPYSKTKEENWVISHAEKEYDKFYHPLTVFKKLSKSELNGNFLNLIEGLLKKLQKTSHLMVKSWRTDDHYHRICYGLNCVPPLPKRYIF